MDGERTSYVLEPPKLAHERPALFESPLRALDDSGGITLAPVKGCVLIPRYQIDQYESSCAKRRCARGKGREGLMKRTHS